MGGRRRRQGAALVVAVIVVVIVTGMGAAFLSEGLFRSKQGFVEREQNEAQVICDAALEQARRYLFLYRDSGTWSWPEILQYNQGFPTPPEFWKQPCVDALNGSGGATARTWPEAPVPAGSTTVPSNPPTYFGVPTLYQNGAFVVVVRDNPDEPLEGAAQDPLTDTDGELLVYVTATMRDGVQRQIEARLRYDPPNYTPNGAIITGGTSLLRGSLNVVGVGDAAGKADVIANGNVDLGGSATIDGKVMAVGSVITSGSATASGGIQTGAPPVLLPNGDPTVYKNLAHYIFKSDGTVVEVGVGVIAVNRWKGWSYSGGQWSSSQKDLSMPMATYYFETSIKMSGKSWINGTAIVQGNVDIQGQGSNVPEIYPSLGDVAVLAGGDVSANGTASITGVIVAREQIRLNGNFQLQGSAVALDEFDYSTLVSTTDSYDDSFLGNASIRYSGGRATFLKVPRYSLSVTYMRRTK